MPTVVIAKADDEIVDLIDRVRSSPDLDVGLVVPASSRALQTPLNVRLLAQFSHQSGRRTAIVTEDSRLQQLARSNGLQVYGSVPAFERGIELAGPRLGSANVGRSTITGFAGGAAASAVLEPPPAPPPSPPAYTPPIPAPATARIEPRRVITQLPPPRPKRGWDRRRLLYVAGAAVAIIGIVLFMTLSPSAKVTITIAATPLSVSPTIQGSTNAATSKQADHVLTGIVNSSSTQSFQASPTGTTNIPATAAKTTLTFSTTGKSDIQFTVTPNNPNFNIQTQDGSITFSPAKSTVICIGPDTPPPPGSCPGGPLNANAVYIDQKAGAQGNVPPGSLTSWPQGLAFNISVTNNSTATLGADAKPVPAASATDLSNWASQVQQLEASLTSALTADLTARAAGRASAVDPTGNGRTVVFAITPTLPTTAGAQFTATQVTITATAEEVVYDPAAVKADVIADLNKLVKPGDQLAPNRLATPPCTVTQASTTGTVVLACSATDFSQPTVNLNSLKSKLTGRNPADVSKLVDSSIAKVQSVHVSVSPFQLFYMPLFASRIEIDESFVAPVAAAP
jgi:hypothetical protein